MSENTTEVLVGGAVLAAAVGFFIYAAQVGGYEMGSSDSYRLSASFRAADGITVGTDVRLAGVRVGSVTDLTLNTETFRADVGFTVLDDVEVPEDSTVAISSEGLLGGNFVELLPGGSLEALAEGDEVYNTQSSVSLVTLLLRYVGGNGGDSTQ
ncbi:outer membrane lipid asymmetry maintenance protein MlaD [Alterinioella nitratireducens]|jgi:phospholipid/cholesterol/gamma-HCH transport system substrate-binding protein|uniref:outer membrane lipid asymmetry maintenance protein MlaD n=1 Tax=Alterinioella nitratireducens TaxID=2735915 RepID=UPI000C43AA40|nr:outer membrane lipid asymmetry maintenance protein MlaD [Alterinioella nitratireducens]MAN15957.1 outer membrane lipid asymmetry maintenance protein MlaD [Dinoroseobacter sp.]MAX75007.1 outer membrane lipid asymmetry maintenance protein MlaD [Nioella sp.]NPD18216.1 outer membrane lipid asymmetry maintenance protein MlaD [Alterinioella nitratireducens]|tara:strand:+ start:1268 stop:1729 length:462 start_codon:yes stop_codon:yes gene_type:complete